MTDDPNLFWFGCVLTLICLCFLSLVRSNPRTPTTVHIQTPIAATAADSNAGAKIAELQQQCLQLRSELQQQKAQLYEDFQNDSFAQLQPLLTNYPSACKMAQATPNLPARNLVALFTPLENLLETWQITPIGTVWEQVPFNAQQHQPDTDDIATGEAVYIRFVGYCQGDRILSPAKVSRTLPGGVRREA
ncbi:nucleotide exchange factor GrpE [Stenomitos frigidus]|uniref:Molecular chaperone GrpE n=1 Tax=Stenomitos frigidus ULC18 TaxID=2107698 RepID=A0A2T1E5W7_9CYAN|nr:molecular chaperone GrpE [Stenomitos frigidus]PSB28085.1 molecular chaperone GrpE [Stenomitos frigidus ULC18]